MTKILLLSLILCSALWSQGSYADLNTFCAQIQKAHDESELTAFQVVKDILALSYKPSKYGKPVVVKAESETTTDNNIEAQNIIFTLDSPKKTKDPENLKAELALLKDLDHQIKQQYKLLRKAMRHKKSADCALFLEKKHFSEEALNQLLQKKNTLFNAKLARESKVLKKAIPEHFLKNEWKLHQTTHLDDLIEVIEGKSLVNIVIITHATENGQLLDSYGNIIPKTFFQNINESVNSLSIYSCHGKKVKEFYQLDKLPAHLKNIFIAQDSEFIGEKEVAPLQAASYFIRKIDKFLSSHTQNIIPLLPAKACLIEVSGISADNSDFGIFLGTKIVGILKQNEQEKTIEINCSDLIAGKTVIGLRSLSLLTTSGKLSLESPSIKVNAVESKLTSALNEQGEISVLKARP